MRNGQLNVIVRLNDPERGKHEVMDQVDAITDCADIDKRTKSQQLSYRPVPKTSPCTVHNPEAYEPPAQPVNSKLKTGRHGRVLSNNLQAHQQHSKEQRPIRDALGDLWQPNDIGQE